MIVLNLDVKVVAISDMSATESRVSVLKWLTKKIQLRWGCLASTISTMPWRALRCCSINGC